MDASQRQKGVHPAFRAGIYVLAGREYGARGRTRRRPYERPIARAARSFKSLVGGDDLLGGAGIPKDNKGDLPIEEVARYARSRHARGSVG